MFPNTQDKKTEVLNHIYSCLRTPDKESFETLPPYVIWEMTAVFQPRSCSFSGCLTPQI